MNMRFVIAATLIVLVVAGCSDKKSQVRVSVQNCAYASECPDIHVSLSGGVWNYDYVLDESKRSTGPLPTGSSGTMHITVALYSAAGKTETTGSLDLSLRKDWRWGVDIFIQEHDPTEYCFGCFGVKSYELDPVLGYDDEVRLYIVWGGNSISNPVDY